MKPETYAKAQQLFLDALQLPESQRVQHVRNHAESEQLCKEVLSLLRFHRQDTVMRDTVINPTVSERLVTPADKTPGAVDPTVVLDPGNRPVPPAPGETPSLMGQRARKSLVDVTERFVKSTNELLRQRLVIATIVLGGILVIATVAVALFGQIVPMRLAVRSITLMLLAACGWYLHVNRQLSNRVLRIFEIFVIATPLIELELIHWFETSEMLITGKGVEIEELRAIIFTVSAIYIAVYGIFIPSNWRRTAVVTGVIAAVPLVVSVVHQRTHSYPEIVQWMHFANPTLVAIMAVVATVGAGIVHQVRREAERAKYYGQYELIEEIGRGGMGIVYLGRHQMLKRPAAIKLIHGEAAGSPQAIAQFEREVQATATLSHWNTVQIYDYGTTEEGDFYCVMEYLIGCTLQKRIDRNGSLSVDATMHVIVQLCDGLEEAHNKGMVHRDIKPTNIFLAEVGGISDVVKLLDFGLVVTKAETDHKQNHLVGGTPAYMSPEQIRGEPLDGRADIYAIGCVIYECLAGTPPFNGLTMTELVSNQLFKVPDMTPISPFGTEVSDLLGKCLAKQADNRFANVAELRDACRLAS